VLLRVDHDVYAMSNSLDQHGADAKLAQPNHWVGRLHQGVLISPTYNCLYFNTCYSATVLHTLLQCGRFVFRCFDNEKNYFESGKSGKIRNSDDGVVYSML
jgi:hypothetical protein